jgi:hypothetical protein
MQTIDLNSPQGNANSLIGIAKSFSKQMQKTSEETNTLIEKMKSGNYKNLVSVFEAEFKYVCKIVGKEF